ncbi:MAG: hypothetical protein HYX68_13875 [Planctomycetes bacterium]|nr:hypothetical protein [Planctomycetota bacterium]
MEILCGLATLGAVAYAGYWIIRWMVATPVGRGVTQHLLSPIELRQRENLRRLNQKARALQVALFKLAEAPDFRRAASWAAQAQDVPLAFRQRQFRRFRPRLVRRFADRLADGGDPAVLLESLQTLVQALGVDTFEADYIRDEAEGHLPSNTQQPVSYSAGLVQLQREHQRRMDALRAVPGLDAETREQLLEAEKTRFREALENLGQQEPGQAVGG